MMYHEATACHVTGDLVELLSIFLSVLKSTRPYLQRKGLAISILVVSSVIKEQNKAFKMHASENSFLSPVCVQKLGLMPANHGEMLTMTSRYNAFVYFLYAYPKNSQACCKCQDLGDWKTLPAQL